MKIGMVLAYEESPYAGVVRPFINWGKFLNREKLAEVRFLLLKVGEKIVETLRGEGQEFIAFRGVDQLVGFIKKEAFDFILIDDYIKRLKILKRIKGSTRRAVYAQVLYGVHSIASVFRPIRNRDKVVFTIARLAPFTLFRRRYLKLISESADIVIANSRITATLLSTLYGIEPEGIVYPPVDTEIFKPHDAEKKDQVLLYLGSHAGDTDEELVKRACRILEDKGYKILAMGNELLARKMRRECKIHYISGIPDVELARTYSESKLTICPQRWEQFGYVVAESVACGTPVLAFNIMGPAEIISITKLGLLANKREELLAELRNFEHKLEDLKIHIDPKELPFSLEASTKELLRILKHSD